MESRTPAMIVLWFRREFYREWDFRGMEPSIPYMGNKLGYHFGDLATNLATKSILLYSPRKKVNMIYLFSTWNLVTLILLKMLSNIVKNMESRIPAMIVLWFRREFYRVWDFRGMEPSIPDIDNKLGYHFGDLATNLTTKSGISKVLEFS
ncbi:hypothetical protein AVEN_213305-1 [Araneus ventricosus]|uniref:Uncharacterized protein n=1 Tax=Araneus ventricosus TaxID=182803 RepID=A0A4Y2KBZ1_ARAVE|nr:hypothetical protein AVEN_213305-1 [Araneus ventricosus]